MRSCAGQCLRCAHWLCALAASSTLQVRRQTVPHRRSLMSRPRCTNLCRPWLQVLRRARPRPANFRLDRGCTRSSTKGLWGQSKSLRPSWTRDSRGSAGLWPARERAADHLPDRRSRQSSRTTRSPWMRSSLSPLTASRSRRLRSATTSISGQRPSPLTPVGEAATRRSTTWASPSRTPAPSCCFQVRREPRSWVPRCRSRRSAVVRLPSRCVRQSRGAQNQVSRAVVPAWCGRLVRRTGVASTH